MTGCGRLGIKVLLLSNQQSNNSLYVCDAILEKADLILEVLEEEEEGEVEGGGGGRDMIPPSLTTTVLL